MKKIICINCGSTNIDFKPKYYQCKHCHTKYKLSKEMRIDEVDSKKEEKIVPKSNYKRFIYFFIAIFITLIGIYFLNLFDINSEDKKVNIEELTDSKTIKIDNSNANIETQSIVINNYNTINKKVAKKKEMKFWNLLFKRDKFLHISSLSVTPLNTYLLAGKADYYEGVYLGELDKNGQEIWSKKFPIGDKITAISLKNGYALSYYTSRDTPETIILNNHKDITHKLKIQFDVMIATKRGFIGVSQDELKSIDKNGEVLWSKSLNMDISRRHDNELVQLQDKSLIVVGRDRYNKIWINKYTQDGELLWQHELSGYHYYVRKVIATTDGGFLLLANNNIQISKYNKDGEQEWKNHTNRNDSYLFCLNIIENSDGYLVTGRRKSKPFVAKFTFDGTKIWDNFLGNQGEVKSIVKAFDGGYLVGININGKEPWLCKMDNNGMIKSDLNSSNYQNFPNTKISYKTNSTIKDKFVTNLTKIIGMANHIKVSEDENYLYASAIGGVHILDIKNKKDPKVLSHFSKSKTEYIRYPYGTVAPKNRSLDNMEGEYKKNYIFDFLVSKDNKRIFVLDKYHGFYVLDIENKKKPKLLLSLSDIYAGSMALSKDEKSIFLPKVSMDKFEIIKIDTKTGTLKEIVIEKRNLKDEKPLIPNNTVKATPHISLLPSKHIILITYKHKLWVYDLKKNKMIKKIKFTRGIGSIAVSFNKKTLYLVSGDETQLLDLKTLSIYNYIYTGGTLKLYPSKDEKKLYVSTYEGIKILDISDINNPKTEAFYKIGTKDFVLSEDENRLYIGGGSIGIVDFVNSDNNFKIVKPKISKKETPKKPSITIEKPLVVKYKGKHSINYMRKVLEYLRSTDIDVWLTSVYEQRDYNSAITLHVKKSDKPVILLLESYRKVTWVIENPYNTKIEAVLLHSRKSVSSVKGEIEQKRVFPVNDALAHGYDTEDEHTSFCQKGRFKSTGSGIRWSKIASYVVWNHKINGLSGAYNPKALYVPAEIVSDKEYLMRKKTLENDEKIRQECIQEEVRLLKMKN